MSSSPPGRATARVALEVEPRLLRDALAAALEREGVTVVDVRDGRCDIVLSSSDEPVAEGGPHVVRVDEAVSTQAGLAGIADLLAVIDGWSPHPAA